MSSSNVTTDSPGKAAILLFPLCDRRGLISELLLSDDAELHTDPENLFFAWLLDLPVSVDPAEAATAIFTASQRSRTAMGQRSGDNAPSRKGPSEELAMVRRKLYQLLHETCSTSMPRTPGRIKVDGRWTNTANATARAILRD